MDLASDDNALLRRFTREGGEDAFAELVRRYLGLVYHTARRQLGAEADAAEDVTQKVFALLARRAAGLLGHQTLAGWLHTTTRFTANEVLRAERRRRAREQQACLMHEFSNTDDANASAWRELRPLIDEAMGQLNKRDREAVLLRFFADLTLAHVGARLNLSENTARMRVERALAKLHALLRRRGITSTVAALSGTLASQAAPAVPAGLAATITSLASTGVTTTLGGGSFASLLTFMNTTKIVVGVAVLLGFAGLALPFTSGQKCDRRSLHWPPSSKTTNPFASDSSDWKSSCAPQRWRRGRQTIDMPWRKKPSMR